MVSYLNLLPLYEKFPGGVHSHLVIYSAAEVHAIFTDADKMIKSVQTGDHEIKQWILLITPPFFLRDITCFTRIKVILKL